jgi:hypothetical protein
MSDDMPLKMQQLLEMAAASARDFLLEEVKSG